MIPNGIDPGRPAAARRARAASACAPSSRARREAGAADRPARLREGLPARARGDAAADRARPRDTLPGRRLGHPRGGAARQAAELGLMEHGTFLGWIGDDVLHSLYRIADVCVVPSIYEPFGLVALEAMASGCPCIVADTGGLREVVPHDEAGLRFRARDPEALAEVASACCDDEAAGERLVAEGLEHVRRFDWADVAGADRRDLRRAGRRLTARRPAGPLARSGVAVASPASPAEPWPRSAMRNRWSGPRAGAGARRGQVGRRWPRSPSSDAGRPRCVGGAGVRRRRVLGPTVRPTWRVAAEDVALAPAARRRRVRRALGVLVPQARPRRQNPRPGRGRCARELSGGRAAGAQGLVAVLAVPSPIEVRLDRLATCSGTRRVEQLNRRRAAARRHDRPCSSSTGSPPDRGVARVGDAALGGRTALFPRSRRSATARGSSWWSRLTLDQAARGDRSARRSADLVDDETAWCSDRPGSRLAEGNSPACCCPPTTSDRRLDRPARRPRP